MKITDVLVACDAVECGYRIVELDDGRYVFVWGNVSASVGDELPPALTDSPTAEKGASVHATYEGALGAYRQCAEALQQTCSRAGDEMLSVLP